LINSMGDHAWLEGVISIEAALQSGSRKIDAILVQQGLHKARVERLLRTAAAAAIKIERVAPQVIGEHSGGTSHGGVVARVGPRRFQELEELIAGSPNPFVAMLDGIEDPFNFGQAIRALYAAGADGLVVRSRSWLSAVSVVARSSAGASERMPTAWVENALDAASFFESQGVTVACATDKQAISVYDADLSVPIFLLVGGERRGITRSFLERAKLRLRIPYGREFPMSLGAAPSTAVIAFEIMRQRRRA